MHCFQCLILEIGNILMRKTLMIPTVALLMLGTAFTASTGANAQPLSNFTFLQNEVADATDGNTAEVMQVQHRKRRMRRDGRRHRGGRGHNNGAGAALGIIGAIVGGAIIANEANRRDRRHIRVDRHVDWCYDRYRSYRASDNTYQPYQGRRRQCHSPY